MQRCGKSTETGKRCSRDAQRGSSYCWQHGGKHSVGQRQHGSSRNQKREKMHQRGGTTAQKAEKNCVMIEDIIKLVDFNEDLPEIPFKRRGTTELESESLSPQPSEMTRDREKAILEKTSEYYRRVFQFLSDCSNCIKGTPDPYESDYVIRTRLRQIKNAIADNDYAAATFIFNDIHDRLMEASENNPFLTYEYASRQPYPGPPEFKELYEKYSEKPESYYQYIEE